MGYEEVVEDLLHPERHLDEFTDLLDRYYEGEGVPSAAAKWIYRMVNTRRPLQEKMALFWHHVFATGWAKSEHGPASFGQIDTFRRIGMSDVRTILIELSRDPAMIFWLDNNENHKTEINENYGRELLELFSMGVGKLQRGRHQERGPRIHRLDVLSAHPPLPVRPLPDAVRLPRG